uniref:Putative secreted protein n=1 Tax=Anopheles darlingi TaxID=43151 RepID=A0A2M4D8G6_ANODA
MGLGMHRLVLWCSAMSVMKAMPVPRSCIPSPAFTRRRKTSSRRPVWQNHTRRRRTRNRAFSPNPLPHRSAFQWMKNPSLNQFRCWWTTTTVECSYRASSIAVIIRKLRLI